MISHINEVDEYTPSIVVNGDLFVQGLQCELSLEGVVTLTDAIYQSQQRLICDISERKDLFLRPLQYATLRLKHIHDDNQTEITYTLQTQVTFIQKPTIWQSKTLQFLGDVNSTLVLHASTEITSATCQFKSHSSYYFSEYKYQGHRKGRCLLPQLIGSLETLQVNLRQEVGDKYVFTNWLDVQLI